MFSHVYMHASLKLFACLWCTFMDCGQRSAFLFGKVAKVLKMLVFFPVVLAFGGWVILVYLDLKGFVFFLIFCSVFVCCWIVFGFVLVLGFWGFFCFFCLCWSVFVIFCLFWLCFLCLLLFCSLCFLEWSRCCYSFCSFWYLLFVFVFVSLCLFLSASYEHQCLPCIFSVIWLLKSESLFLVSVSGFGFSLLFYLLFVSRCFSVCSLVLFCITILNFCLASCFLVVFCFCCFGIVLFFELWLPSKNISQKIGNSENPQMQSAENGHLDNSS